MEKPPPKNRVRREEEEEEHKKGKRDRGTSIHPQSANSESAFGKLKHFARGSIRQKDLEISKPNVKNIKTQPNSFTQTNEKSSLKRETATRKLAPKDKNSSPVNPEYTNTEGRRPSNPPSVVLSTLISVRRSHCSSIGDLANPSPVELPPPNSEEEKEDFSERNFILRFGSELSEMDLIFMSETPRSLYSFWDPEPISPCISYKKLATFAGPGDLEEEEIVGSIACGRTISSYPHLPGNSTREGDPICDQFCFIQMADRSISCVADGCNWGQKPRIAAKKAAKAFTDYLFSKQHQITDLQNLGNFLLRACSEANKSISAHLLSALVPTPSQTSHTPSQTSLSSTSQISSPLPSNSNKESSTSQNKTDNPERSTSPGRSGGPIGGVLPKTEIHSWDTGTTTLLGGMTFKLSNNNQWMFACISVGDCKAFHYSIQNNKIVDITKDNRGNINNASDPGGRLGPYKENSGPDLRNITLYKTKIFPSDMVFIVSDGVHDNLDVELLGFSAQQYGLEDWSSAVDEISEIKNQFREQYLAYIISNHNNLNPLPFCFNPTPPLSPSLSPSHSPPSSSKRNNQISQSIGKLVTPRTIVSSILSHCLEVTKSSRYFMETEPFKRLPNDYSLFPGKLDHTTCLCFNISLQTSQLSQLSIFDSMATLSSVSSLTESLVTLLSQTQNQLDVWLHNTPLCIQLYDVMNGYLLLVRISCPCKVKTVVSPNQIYLQLFPEPIDTSHILSSTFPDFFSTSEISDEWELRLIGNNEFDQIIERTIEFPSPINTSSEISHFLREEGILSFYYLKDSYLSAN